VTQRNGDATPKASLSLLIGALSISFGAAIALGLARFSYALLLPSMKADLGWTFAQAGALNTSNAIGYMGGALAFPFLSRRIAIARLFLGGCVLTALAMAAAGLTFDFDLLLAQRLACGLFSAMIFVAGGVLATRLATDNTHHSGLVLGVYYGGSGWGIAMAALVVPASLGNGDHGWQAAWIALAIACAFCSALAWPMAARMSSGVAQARADSAIDKGAPLQIARFLPLLGAYGLFGVGYIGYMTFVIALLRAAGMSPAVVTAFYVTLGLATVASGKLWSGVLHRARGGGAFALFCALLGAATLAPALTNSPIVAFASGLVFGGTFLSVVTSTTAFVRHNLSPARWPAGISIFTIVFALGQTAGPVVMGTISDGTSLSRGFLYSSIILLIAASIAAAQKPLEALHR
jgi:predicted MFS family arabinose efflux permease